MTAQEIIKWFWCVFDIDVDYSVIPEYFLMLSLLLFST